MRRNNFSDIYRFIFFGFFILSTNFYPQTVNDNISKYNIEWLTPSKDFTGSMPIGNGDIGLNVWVEENGDVLFLIGKTDSYDENSTLLKLGRIRLRFTPNPFISNNSFKQVLHIDKGEITINEGNQINTRIWVDANNPVINVETDGNADFKQEVFLETWRDSIYQMKTTEVSDLFKNLYGPDKYSTYYFPDVYKQNDTQIKWYHHNHKPENDGYEINMKLQGLDDNFNKQTHPLYGRIFGAILEGENFIVQNEKKLITKSNSSNHNFSIYVLTQHPSTIEKWESAIDSLASTYKKKNKNSLIANHHQWWNEFWDRSFVNITSSNDKNDSSAFIVSRAYNLSRYLNACAGRGSIPIKFNGSIFSYGTKDNPDYRRWGGPGFWFQNQRLIYYPMFAQGDFDLMQAWFNMYHNILPLQKDRTKRFFNHEGAFFPETITFWGTEVSGHYGWTPFNERQSPNAECTYLTFYWQNSIEQILMMFDYYEYTQDSVFALNVLIPQSEEVMKFYKFHYQMDNLGKFHFGPAQSLETYHVAFNPLPEIAGLNYTLNKLMSLPNSYVTDEQKDLWKFIYDHLPPLPMRKDVTKNILTPANFYDMKMNIENPELYAVFPYRLFGIGKPDIETALNTFDARLHKEEYCWHQNAVDAALLGLIDTVKNLVTNRSLYTNYNKSRFPAMWNDFHDWIPDVDHGGNLQLAINYMLLQCEGKEVRLLPSWPKDWDVEFKLHAPYKTIVEAKVVKGKLEYLNVTPKDRLENLIVPEQFK